MAYFISNTNLDIYSNPRENDIELDSLTEKCINFIHNPKNWISISHLTPESYGTKLSETIPTNTHCAVYAIIRTDPINSDTKDYVAYAYYGSCFSVESSVNSRNRKFIRHLFGHNGKTDRHYQYVDKFLHQFGDNLDNTFVCYFGLPYNPFTATVEQQVDFDLNTRLIEGNVIDISRRRYGAQYVANVKTKPTRSYLSDAKRRQRAQPVVSVLQFD